MARIPSFFRSVRRAFAALTVAAALLAPGVRAQAVDASLSLDRPAPGVSHDVAGLRTADNPSIAILTSDQARGMSTQAASRVRDAVYGWEVLLLGLQVPFRTLDDRTVARGLPKDLKLLILPSAEALSGGQRKTVLRFVEKGGSVIASGQVGQFDERGRAVNDPFFTELFGAEYVRNVPEQPYGLLHTIDGASSVGYGVPPGFRLNIAAQRPLSAARPLSATALGTMVSYSGRDDARLEGLTLMLLNQHGDGHAMWLRFGPQDVSRERMQQAAYQRLIVNAIARLTGARTAAVRAWPFGARSALSVATLPTVGFDPLAFLAGYDDVLGTLASLGVSATHFVTTGEAVGFPDVLSAMSATGEVALAGESDDVLLGQPLDVQAGRLASSRNTLTGSSRGLYPPGGYHDGNTLRAAVEGGFAYVLVPGGQSLAPSVARWWEDVDYRTLQAASQQVDLAFLRTNTRRTPRTERRVQVAEPTPAIVLPLDAGIKDYMTRFEEVDAAGGLYVLPFYPESDRAGSNRSMQLQDVLATARDRNVWMTTLHEVVSWWGSLAGVSVEIVDSGRETFTVEVTNSGADALDGVTLELSLGDVGFDTIDAGDLNAELARGDGTYHLVIDRLPTGTSAFTLNLYR